ncbi:hypothetical protein HYV81_01670 [Candidatus Woesearchaeota archaeon]|nr:hypothetical protein [Candidatus Woesearchaeota archaeon]
MIQSTYTKESFSKHKREIGIAANALAAAAYVDHFKRLGELHQIPWYALVIGTNWSYSLRIPQKRQALLEQAHPFIKGILSQECEPQLFQIFPEVPLTIDMVVDLYRGALSLRERAKPGLYVKHGEPISVFLVGAQRVAESEGFQQELKARSAVVGIHSPPNLVLFHHIPGIEEIEMIPYIPKKEN